MKTDTKIIIFLLLLAPTLGEFITASAPPLVFFNPFIFSVLVLLYGCGVLLIREANVRWGLQWSIVFLAIAYGIIEEGLAIQTFFNPGNADVGILSGFGTYFGVQWPWTLMITYSHATISILIPIAIAGLLWPEYKNVQLLKKKGIIISFIGFLLVNVIGMVVVGPSTFEAPNHPPGIISLGITFLVALLLIWLAYMYRESRILPSDKYLFSPLMFGVFGFLFISINSVIIPTLFTGFGLSALVMIFVQLALIISTFLFIVHQIYNKDITKRHIVSFIFGSVLFWILLMPAYEFNLAENPDPTQGMFIAGIISLILLIIWKRNVLKK